MLLREVFAWLRYCLQHDPICLAVGIVVEEIPSPFLSVMDVNDGPRTLAIFKADNGYSPRVEIRFTGERPQVWWISDSSVGEHGASYLLSPYSSRFPGDVRAWSRTQFVSYLIDLARSKFANDTVTFLSLIPNRAVPAKTEVDALSGPAKLPFENFMQLVNTAHRAKSKGTKTSADKIIDFVMTNAKVSKTQVGLQLAKDAAYYLDKQSNKFNHMQLQDLVDWLKKSDNTNLNIETPLCHELSDPKLEKHLSQDWMKACNIKVAASTVEAQIKSVVEAKNSGKDVRGAVEDAHYGQFGEVVEASLRDEAIPLPYLALLEKADYKEALAPWSMIRRSIIAYEIPKDNKSPIQDEIVAWLDHAHLITALYKNADDTMKELLARKVKAFADRTIGNQNWVKEICNEIVSYTNEYDRAKALQSEFDMWLLQALSPSLAGSKLPLSPHAFNTGREDEELYNKAFGSWLYTVKKSAADRREHSIKSLASALDSFYKQVGSEWKKESLEDYSPRMPSIKDIMATAIKGDKDRLFNVLVADVEQEMGVKVPEQVRANLIASPFFNSVFREIRFQSVKI
jgi:hypothetical protein